MSPFGSVQEYNLNNSITNKAITKYLHQNTGGKMLEN